MDRHLEQKTKGIALDPKETRKQIAGIDISRGPEKVLGIPQGLDWNMDEFGEGKMKKIDGQLKIWETRNLSMCGKVNIVKTLAVPNLMYCMQTRLIPEHIKTGFDRKVRDFIWKKKRMKVKREKCILTPEKGGIGMPDIYVIEKVRRISLVQRILKDGLEKWKIIPLASVQKLDNKLKIKNFLLKVRDASDIIRKLNIPEFYKHVILCLQELRRKCQTPISVNDILNQYLWCNDLISIDRKPVLFTNWAQAGFKKVKDIVRNGKIDFNMVCNKLVQKAGFVFEKSKVTEGFSTRMVSYY